MAFEGRTDLPKVAYFCMEYGLDEEFRIYAGGLGILAGDHIKSAKDLSVPLVAVGLLWHQGYTTQMIGEDGRPYDIFPKHDYSFLIDTGVVVRLKLRNKDLSVKVWKTEKYGNATLFLLDTALPENEDDWITNQLYGGGADERIAQEIVLGIGGVKALRALGLEPDVYHFNEGHAVFAGIELIREKMEKGASFEDACGATRRQIVFTTHTPVPAGNETHDLHRLIYWGANNGLTQDQMVLLGGGPFSMTVAGLRLSRLANGVSQLHGETARHMWQHIDRGAPIIAITNGVHRPTWQSVEIREAVQSGGDLWEAHQRLKKGLLDKIVRETGVRMSPDSILIGFARRAAPYKRHDLIFRHQEIIEPLLNDGEVQLVFAGRAHPNDRVGKDVIANLVKMARRYPKSIVFLQNYDIELGKYLTTGCDIWLNNPTRPLEASGTSGMKAAMNGVLNLSVLDGWWPEACREGVNGWEIGGGYEGCDQDERDHHDLYDVLRKEILPIYYRDRAKWVSMMKASIEDTQYQFSSDRMVLEYYARMYKGETAASETAAGHPMAHCQR